jgi:hypothetical protein
MKDVFSETEKNVVIIFFCMSDEMRPLMKTPFKFKVEHKSDSAQEKLIGMINDAVIKLEFNALSVTQF